MVVWITTINYCLLITNVCYRWRSITGLLECNSDSANTKKFTGLTHRQFREVWNIRHLSP